MVDENRTICVECKNHRKWKGTNLVLYFCDAPEAQRQTQRDLVTGEEYYIAFNGEGESMKTGERSPLCLDINNGQCPHYQSNL